MRAEADRSSSQEATTLRAATSVMSGRLSRTGSAPDRATASSRRRRVGRAADIGGAQDASPSALGGHIRTQMRVDHLDEVAPPSARSGDTRAPAVRRWPRARAFDAMSRGRGRQVSRKSGSEMLNHRRDSPPIIRQ